MIYDVIIVGGGPAGYTAALYSARGNLKTLLIEKLFTGGQMATTDVLENYPGFIDPINGIELAGRMEGQAKRFGAESVNEEVVELELTGDIKTVKTTDNEYKCKAVILATGGTARKLGLPNEEKLIGRGVSYCATCDGSFYRDKTVAIIGGGDTAVEDANYLSRLCEKVYIVHRRDELRAAKSLQTEVFNNPKVEVVWNSVVDGINGKDSLESVKLRNTKTDEITKLGLDGVFVAIGSTPNTTLVKNKIELSESGHIVTDENMQTNLPNVYACGDVREKSFRQVVTAVADGAIASFIAEKNI